MNNQISQAVTSSGQNLSHLVLVVFLLVRAPLGLPDVNVIVKDKPKSFKTQESARSVRGIEFFNPIPYGGGGRSAPPFAKSRIP